MTNVETTAPSPTKKSTRPAAPCMRLLYNSQEAGPEIRQSLNPENMCPPVEGQLRYRKSALKHVNHIFPAVVFGRDGENSKTHFLVNHDAFSSKHLTFQLVVISRDVVKVMMTNHGKNALTIYDKSNDKRRVQMNDKVEVENDSTIVFGGVPLVFKVNLDLDMVPGSDVFDGDFTFVVEEVTRDLRPCHTAIPAQDKN